MEPTRIKLRDAQPGQLVRFQAQGGFANPIYIGIVTDRSAMNPQSTPVFVLFSEGGPSLLTLHMNHDDDTEATLLDADFYYGNDCIYRTFNDDDGVYRVAL